VLDALEASCPMPPGHGRVPPRSWRSPLRPPKWRTSRPALRRNLRGRAAGPDQDGGQDRSAADAIWPVMGVSGHLVPGCCCGV